MVSKRRDNGWDSDLPTVADTNWQLVASADINRDGASDLIWRQRVSGDHVVWYLNGTTLVGAANLPTVADTNWELVASSDINGDGGSDLIWRQRVSGAQCRVVSESNNTHRDSFVADCRRWDLANDRSQVILTARIYRLSTLGEI